MREGGREGGREGTRIGNYVLLWVPISNGSVTQLAKSFAELRELNNDGEIKYPYSTREAVGAVRHLQQFPNEGIEGSLKNLLDFDTYDPSLMAKLHSVFLNNGIVLPDVATMVRGQWGVKGGRGERASLDEDEDEHTCDGSREMATDGYTIHY